MSKLSSIRDAVQSIENGALLALGGNALHRSPIAFVLELIRQKKKDLSLIKTAGALDVDLLALSKSIRSVSVISALKCLDLRKITEKGFKMGKLLFMNMHVLV